MICNSFRIAAPIITIGFFPCFLRRPANSLMRGFNRIAVIAGKYKSLRKHLEPIFDKWLFPLTEVPEERNLGLRPP